MPSIADTIRRFHDQRLDLISGSGPMPPPRLQRMAAFGTNPGALNGWFYSPAGAGAGAMALVVVLHGCTQTAAGYDHGSGWTDLAERFDFAVLFPEQQRANNANLCFNWFLDADTRRGAGEALSIRQMIDAALARHPIDPGRVFVTGLSAGGAMTGAMLASYPELFAGGAIVAGLPFGSASDVPTALERMRGRGLPTATAAAAAVRAASPHRGPWPRVAVWHGDADHVVDAANADAILAQWRAVHGTATDPDLTELVDGQRHRAWLGRDGEIAVEDYRIAGLGHGTPLMTGGAEGCGHAGAHMIEAGISSTWRQARRWGLIATSPATAAAPAVAAGVPPRAAAVDAGTMAGVTATIERALRSAGLMR